MPELKCNVKSCYYNDSNRCSLDSIKVEGSHANEPSGTACGSFRLRKEESASNSCGAGAPKETVSVKCEALKCKYNEEYDCTAKDIGIAGGSACTCGETKCASFDKE